MKHDLHFYSSPFLLLFFNLHIIPYALLSMIHCTPHLFCPVHKHYFKTSFLLRFFSSFKFLWQNFHTCWLSSFFTTPQTYDFYPNLLFQKNASWRLLVMGQRGHYYSCFIQRIRIGSNAIKLGLHSHKGVTKRCHINFCSVFTMFAYDHPNNFLTLVNWSNRESCRYNQAHVWIKSRRTRHATQSPNKSIHFSACVQQ